MNGVLYEMFQRHGAEYIESPRMSLSTICTTIATGLRDKILEDMTANFHKNEILNLLDEIITNGVLSDIFFNIDDYDETLFSNLTISAKTLYVLNYIFFNNFASTFQQIHDFLSEDKLVWISGFYFFFYFKSIIK